VRQIAASPGATASPPPDPKLLIAQAKVQSDQAIAAHQAQAQQQKAQNDAIHLQVKNQAEIELARIKAELDARMAVLDAHLKGSTEPRKTPRSHPPGTQKARDGHHYVPDSKRPGRFLMVVHHT
jgi:hypothetical protein